MMRFIFAWAAKTDIAFNAAVHGIESEDVFEHTLSQNEGDFASLEIEIRNPRIGLLAPGRPRWAWFSCEDPNGAITPLFFGRIVGLPTEINADTIRLTFIARPANYDEVKEALAASLRVAPFYDPLWLDETARLEADSVLESRCELWHVDRATHDVTTSNSITGEDGLLSFGEDSVVEGSVQVSYGDAPKRRVEVKASVTWKQSAASSLPIFNGLKYPRFSAVAYPSSALATFTGDGLVTNWPKPGANIGGGWSIGVGTQIKVLDGFPDMYSWSAQGLRTEQGFSSQESARGRLLDEPFIVPSLLQAFTYLYYRVLYVRYWSFVPYITLDYKVERSKTELLNFNIESDVQDILSDSAESSPIVLDFKTADVLEYIDQGATPLASPRARSYLPTNRGTRSIEYLICVARAHLLSAARCVEISFDVFYEDAIALNVTCRKNASITDKRLPGGVAVGKIKSYVLSANGNGESNCKITIACTLGRGGIVNPVAGSPSYVAENYVETDYQKYNNQIVVPLAGEIGYESIEGDSPIDDGIDFDKMYPSQVVEGFTIENLRDEQRGKIQSYLPRPDIALQVQFIGGPYLLEPAQVYEAVNSCPTRFYFRMKPLDTGPFETAWDIETTKLAVPKMIDLEAESRP